MKEQKRDYKRDNDKEKREKGAKVSQISTMRTK
jgi:hypothetical protein